MADLDEVLRFSSSVVTQGERKFYTLTVPSEVLAKTCFVTTRDEDPLKGFQRVLDKKRAREIADYIDSGLGTIPTSIVLSAQPDAELRDLSRGKTVEFKATRYAFLVLDGQHRIWGFSLAKKHLRIPVVIYNGLSRKDESRLFIDINTTQRPVPNELLLDIRKLAEYETDREKLMGEVFDQFSGDTTSPLVGLMSPSKRVSNKLSRVSFNAAVRPILSSFGTKDSAEIYEALKGYIGAFMHCLRVADLEKIFVNPVFFRAVCMVFPEIAQRVKDRFGSVYTEENFFQVIDPMFNQLRPNIMRKPGNSAKDLAGHFTRAMKVNFTI